jgi:hypothetical protein
MMFFIFITALSVCCTSQSHAAVNLRTAGLIKTFQDPAVGMQRTYNSRSLYRGVFGFGWCSDMEARVLREGNRVKLVLCDREIPVRVVDNQRLQTADGRTFVFLKDGSLGGFGTTREDFRIERDTRGRPMSLIAMGGYRFDIAWSAEGDRIVSLTPKDGKTLRFNYAGPNLVSVTWGSRRLFAYDYDQLNNLTAIEYIDGARDQVDYDPERDWVVRIRHRDTCVDDFEYVTLTPGNYDRFKATARRTCGRIVQKSVDRIFGRNDGPGGTL